MRTTVFSVLVLLCLVTSPGGAAHAAPAPAPAPAKQAFLACRKDPNARDMVKMNIKPRSQLRDVVSFMSTLSCQPLFFADDVSLDHEVTLSTPKLLSWAEAYDVFMAALKSAGLSLRPEGKVLRIVKG
jgi:hypothetical protein